MTAVPIQAEPVQAVVAVLEQEQELQQEDIQEHHDDVIFDEHPPEPESFLELANDRREAISELTLPTQLQKPSHNQNTLLDVIEEPEEGTISALDVLQVATSSTNPVSASTDQGPDFKCQVRDEPEEPQVVTYRKQQPRSRSPVPRRTRTPPPPPVYPANNNYNHPTTTTTDIPVAAAVLISDAKEFEPPSERQFWMTVITAALCLNSLLVAGVVIGGFCVAGKCGTESMRQQQIPAPTPSPTHNIPGPQGMGPRPEMEFGRNPTRSPYPTPAPVPTASPYPTFGDDPFSTMRGFPTVSPAPSPVDNSMETTDVPPLIPPLFVPPPPPPPPFETPPPRQTPPPRPSDTFVAPTASPTTNQDLGEDSLLGLLLLVVGSFVFEAVLVFGLYRYYRWWKGKQQQQQQKPEEEEEEKAPSRTEEEDIV